MNNLYLYLQNINSYKTEYGMEYFCESFNITKMTNGIDLDKLDNFLITITEVFLNKEHIQKYISLIGQLGSNRIRSKLLQFNKYIGNDP